MSTSLARGMVAFRLHGNQARATPPSHTNFHRGCPATTINNLSSRVRGFVRVRFVVPVGRFDSVLMEDETHLTRPVPFLDPLEIRPEYELVLPELPFGNSFQKKIDKEDLLLVN